MNDEALSIIRATLELAEDLNDQDSDYCHFCNSHCTLPHEDDCLYIRAKTFIEDYDRETIARSSKEEASS